LQGSASSIYFLGNIDTANGELKIVDHLSFFKVFELDFILGEAWPTDSR
jgi:hypothetical protein